MPDLTRLIEAAQAGDPVAANQLLPLVYDELRKLAAAKMAGEKPGHSLDATALVHEAYLRLVSADQQQRWNGRGHFFGAAAEAMRRILVENARRKLHLRRGGELQRQELNADGVASPHTPENLVALSAALDMLSAVNPQAAELVKLRFFAGLTNEEAAAAIDVSPRKANQIWAYARAWLLESLDRQML
jgi:RNA polymerase sigma factor (TIGR02999 family)